MRWGWVFLGLGVLAFLTGASFGASVLGFLGGLMFGVSIEVQRWEKEK